MAKRVSGGKKQTKKSNRQLSLSPIRLFFMERLKSWCNAPSTREEKTGRKQEISKLLGKNIQTVKNMYLYGQGSIDDWFTVMDHIGALNQDMIIQLYDSYPYIEKKLQSLSTEQQRMYRNVGKMTEKELSLVNDLIEVGLKANLSIQESESGQ